MNRHAMKVFSYLRLHHSDIWVRLGSPATLKADVAGTRDPSWTFIMDREYRRLGNPALNSLCDALRTEQIVLLLTTATIVLALVAGLFVTVQ